uniref:ENTH domain-containing protein n=1 Tax=Clastoptera arizonana TaxID=38151 RepID=A0A1B6E1R6_9HEMI
MKRQREDMQVNVAGLRRNIKNLAHNYSDAQIKVREATSNDHWGPSSTLMSEIADLTYNVVAFTEIMQMIWKRLNDHGKNWRHVYKALVLLEYLIKTGTEKVAQQCKENIFAIQTLRDFQYSEEGKDQGLNVREKAKQLVLLLKDDERLRNERTRALKAKERFAQTASGFGSDTGLDAVSPSSPNYPAFRDSWNSCPTDAHPPIEIECARPQTVGEEELQLQLALAMSREEAQQEEQKRRSDDVRLQLALSQSENEFKQQIVPKENQSHMLDLLDVNLGNPSPTSAVDPWGLPQPAPVRPQTDPWSTSTGTPSTVDPWTPAASQIPPKPDPWRAVSPPRPPAVDPWSPVTESSPAHSLSPPNQHQRTSPLGELDEFDVIMNRDKNANSINNNRNGGSLSPDPFDLTGLTDTLSSPATSAPKKTPHSFLGENSSLVNLDNLVTKSTIPPAPTVPLPTTGNDSVFSILSFSKTNRRDNSFSLANPFSASQGAGATAMRPTINQIRQPAYPPGSTLPQPLVPQPNPFLS